MKFIHKTLCLVTLVYLLQGCQAQIDPTKIEAAVENRAQLFLQDARISSVSINIYADGKFFSNHFGELDKGKGNTPTDSTLYEIASVTKTMTGYLVAKAIHDKKIALDDPVTKFLGPAYKNLSFQGNPITIQHLLTHTSGLPLNMEGIDELQAQGTKEACEKAQKILTNYTKESFLKALQNVTIQQAPGVQYSYSNVAPNILAYILEMVYQKPFEILIKEELFTPLGMEATAINLSDAQQLLLTNGYNDNGERMPSYKQPIQLWGAAGRVKSNSQDLLKYIQFQLQKENSIVQATHSKLFRDLENVWIGYFWEIIEDENGTRLEHHGGLYGMQNWMIVYPEYNVGISILTNASFPETSQLLKATATDIFNDILN
ncbi:MAG: serine hydrolase domain-containing protein [Bacteroidota bacterium]